MTAAYTCISDGHRALLCLTGSGPGPVVHALGQCHQSVRSAHTGTEQYEASHVKSKGLHR